MSKSDNESLDRRIERLIAPEIRALSAYAVADARGLIKLDAMENPYPWPAELEDAWLERLREVEINRYPDPRAAGLKTRLRQVMEIPQAAGLLLGNGSDELIQLLVLAIGGAGSVVLAPDPSFAMYALVSRVTGRRFVTVALDESNFDLRIEATLDAIREHRPALTFIAYPNNPTGNLFATEHLDAVLHRHDKAYTHTLLYRDQPWFSRPPERSLATQPAPKRKEATPSPASPVS